MADKEKKNIEQVDKTKNRRKNGLLKCNDRNLKICMI
jgi:hypothetical protein